MPNGHKRKSLKFENKPSVNPVTVMVINLYRRPKMPKNRDAAIRRQTRKYIGNQYSINYVV
jgi:hypothetical protein